MGNYNLADIVNYFDYNLSILVDGNIAYVIDDYRLGEEDFDYGIYAHFSVDDLKKGKTDKDLIPDLYADGIFQDIEENILPEYGVRETDIEDICKEPYSDWSEKLKEYGYLEASEHIAKICGIFNGYQYEPMTDEEIDHIRIDRLSYEYENIKAYNEIMEIDTKDIQTITKEKSNKERNIEKE